MRPVGDLLELRFGNNAINFNHIRKGDWVWRSYDANTAKAAKPFTQANSPVHKQAVSAHVIANEGQQLSIHWQLEKFPGIQTTVTHDEPLGRANNRPVTVDYLGKQLSRLGNTAYELHHITAGHWRTALYPKLGFESDAATGS
jgi:hypothetical protein